MIVVKIDAGRSTAVLQQIMDRVADPTELMSGVGMLLESSAQQAFQDQGPGWADLAESTKAQRTKAGNWPGQKLVRKGGDNGLLGSLFSDSGSDWANIGAGSGPSAAYAAIHQFGGKAGRGKKTTIPARPYMPITPDGKDLTEAASESVLALTMTYLGLP
jgi:phage virion morphogenesis protein